MRFCEIFLMNLLERLRYVIHVARIWLNCKRRYEHAFLLFVTFMIRCEYHTREI